MLAATPYTTIRATAHSSDDSRRKNHGSAERGPAASSYHRVEATYVHPFAGPRILVVLDGRADTVPFTPRACPRHPGHRRRSKRLPEARNSPRQRRTRSISAFTSIARSCQKSPSRNLILRDDFAPVEPLQFASQTINGAGKLIGQFQYIVKHEGDHGDQCQEQRPVLRRHVAQVAEEQPIGFEIGPRDGGRQDQEDDRCARVNAEPADNGPLNLGVNEQAFAEACGHLRISFER